MRRDAMTEEEANLATVRDFFATLQAGAEPTANYDCFDPR